MKRTLIFIILALIYISVQGQNQIQFKKATVTDWLIYQRDTLVKWYKESDTAKTIYHVLIDSSFLVKYGNTQFGHGEYLGTPLLGMFETDGDTSTAIFLVHDIDEWGSGIITQIADTVAHVGVGYDPTGDMKIYVQLHTRNASQTTNLNVTPERILLESDTTRITGQIFAPGIEPEAGAKFYQMVGYGLDGRLFPRTIIDWYDDIQDSIAKTPTIYSTWVRDTINGYLYPATLTDKVGIGVNDPAEMLEVNGNIEIPATSSTVGQIKQGGATIFHTYSDDVDEPNIFIGYNSGNFTSSGNYNAGVGGNTMSILTSGIGNTAMGASSLAGVASGGLNTAIGYEALQDNVSSNANTAVGHNALENTTGGFNTAVGGNAGITNTGGLYNTYIGFEAGYSAVGSRNVMLGYKAGRLETGSDKLYISNSDADSTGALIFGNFATGKVRINGTFSASDISGNTTVDGNLSSDTVTSEVGVIPTILTDELKASDGTPFLRYSTGSPFATALGHNAGASALKTETSSIGWGAGASSTGDYGTHIGTYSAELNSGNKVTSLGIFSANFNYGDNVVAIGYDAVSSNSGNNVVAIGDSAGMINSYSNVILLGRKAEATQDNQAVIGTPTIESTLLYGVVEAKKIKILSAVYDSLTTNAITSEAVTIDWSVSNINSLALSDTVTVTFTAPPGPCHLTLKITHANNATVYPITWPATVKWAGGTAITTTATANAVDIASFFYDGTNYYGMFGNDFK